MMSCLFTLYDRFEYFMKRLFKKQPLFYRHVVQDEKDPEFMLHPAFLQGIEQLIKYGYCYDILVYARQLPQVLASFFIDM